MKRAGIVVVLLAALAFAVTIAPSPLIRQGTAAPPHGFDVGDLIHTYVGTFQGHTGGAAVSGIARLVADGNGSASLALVVVDGSGVQGQTLPYSYTVDPDGRVHLTPTTSGGAVEGFLSDRGKTIDITFFFFPLSGPPLIESASGRLTAQ